MKLFLACSVPYSQGESFAININFFIQKRRLKRPPTLKVPKLRNSTTHLNSGNVFVVELVFDVAKHQTGFPHATLAQ